MVEWNGNEIWLLCIHYSKRKKNSQQDKLNNYMCRINIWAKEKSKQCKE